MSKNIYAVNKRGDCSIITSVTYKFPTCIEDFDQFKTLDVYIKALDFTGVGHLTASNKIKENRVIEICNICSKSTDHYLRAEIYINSIIICNKCIHKNTHNRSEIVYYNNKLYYGHVYIGKIQLIEDTLIYTYSISHNSRFMSFYNIINNFSYTSKCICCLRADVYFNKVCKDCHQYSFNNYYMKHWYKISQFIFLSNHNLVNDIINIIRQYSISLKIN